MKLGVLVLLGVGVAVACSGGNDGSGPGAQDRAEAVSACEAFCDYRQQAGCTTPEARAICEANCTEDATLEPACVGEFAAMLGCANAPMTCSPGGSPRIARDDCAPASGPFDTCMEENGWVSVGGESCSLYTCKGICHFAFGCIECWENTDCAPTQECSFSTQTCRERCLSDADCPGSFCTSRNLCGDPVGTPCTDAFSQVCEGGRCTDVDANLTTVEPYCTILCIGSPCPAGYACQENECRRM